MTFPTVTSTNTSVDLADVTTHTVSLPATVSVDDWLIISAAINGIPTVTAPTGWTKAQLEIGNVNATHVVFKKKANGTEGGTTVTFTTDVVEKSAHISMAGAQWDGDINNIEISTGAIGSSVNADPDAITASWGSADNLFIALMAQQRTGSLSGYPTNYTDNQLSVSTGAAGSDIIAGAATRNVAVATEDPGDFTVGTARNWVAATVVIKPVVTPTGPVITGPGTAQEGVATSIIVSEAATVTETTLQDSAGTYSVVQSTVLNGSNLDVTPRRSVIAPTPGNPQPGIPVTPDITSPSVTTPWANRWRVTDE